jgi:hypothetical protein
MIHLAFKGATGALLAALVGCNQEPLAFLPHPIPVGFDRVDVLDADAVDLDRNGPMDIVALTAEGFRYLELAEGRYTDRTGGTALGKVEAAEAMYRDGHDYVLQRGDDLVRLEYSGIGSWHEVDDPVEGFEPAPTVEVAADLDGDGTEDRARLVGDRIVIELSRGGRWLDVTTLVAADGLRLPKPGRRLRAADLDGDGHVDLLVVGGRLIALMNNGGELTRP